MPASEAPLTAAKIQQQIASERKKIARERKSAVGTMTPDQMRRAIHKGEIDPFAVLTWGQNQKGQDFGIDDLKGFARSRERVSKEFKKTQGAPIVKIIARSLAEDIQRANTDIQRPTLFKVHSGVLHFKVPSSGKDPTAPPYYGVRIRLDEWTTHMGSYAHYKDAVRASIKGNVSMDCTCGRYQYYLRYVATAAKVALRPEEKDYPKINNPKLMGLACKHQIKALKVLLTPTYQRELERHMEYQASDIGFSGDTKHKTLSLKSMAALEKARPQDVDLEKFKAKAKKLEQAQKQYKKKVTGVQRDTDYVKRLEKERKSLVNQLKKSEAARDQLMARVRRDSEAGMKKTPATSKLSNELKKEIEGAKRYGGSAEQAIRYFKDKHKLTLAKVRKMAKEIDS